MASDVAVDAYDNEHQSSSPTPSSDSDSANTSTSRVYFGPVQSAEKRRFRQRDSGHQTPLRRSARRSGGLSLLAFRNSAGGEDENNAASSNEIVASDQSRPDTPTPADDAFEEPSSALATRVLSACGNPSPPPSPLLSPQKISKREQATLSDEDNAVPLLSLEEGADTSPIAPETANLIPESARAHTDTQTDHTVEAQADEVDLINFDSFIAPPVPAVNLLPATPPRSLPSAPYSVDDLLAPTPIRPPPGETSSPEQRVQGSPLSQEHSSSGEKTGAIGTLSSRQTPPAPPAPVVSVLAELVEAEPSLEPKLKTPLRRSTRPRRSVSPYSSATPSRASPSPNVEAGSARRKQHETKEQDVISGLFAGWGAATTALDVPLLDIPRELESISPNTDIQHKSDDNGFSTALVADTGKGKHKESPGHHHLRSLSPASTRLLMQLLPSSNSDLDATTAEAPLKNSPPNQNASNSTLPSDNDTSTLPPFCLDDQAPEPPSTPKKDVLAFTQVTRTPARRIPISQAIAQGTVSPAKAPVFAPPHSSGSNAVHGIFNARLGGDVPRTPAKRVPIAEAVPFLPSPSKPAVRPASPTKSSHVRSMSEDRIQPVVPKFQRSTSAEPVQRGLSMSRPGELPKRSASAQSTSQDGSQKGSELPSLITPLNIPPSIQETDEAGPHQQSRPTSKIPSGLRQPSLRAESKIPRPGAKPYARPPTTNSSLPTARVVPSLPKKTLPATSASNATGAAVPPAVRPMRIRKVVSNKPPVEVSSGSDDMPQPVAGPGPRTASSRLVRHPVKHTSAAPDSTPPLLKRKREHDEPGTSRASPSGVKPVVLIRKVPPAPPRFNKPAATAIVGRQASGKPSPPKSPGPLVVNGGLKLRKAVGKKKPESPAPSPPLPKPDSPMDVVPPSPPAQAQTIDHAVSPANHAANEAQVDIVVDLAADTAAQQGPQSTNTQEPRTVADAAAAQPSTDVPSESEADAASYGLRRGTRARKAPTTDVFGVVAPTRTAGGRRRPLLLADNSVFSGMTALALKSLTSTNTQRNQRQVAEIQMEVVMKDGRRPDSPTTKVRTNLDRQREERIQQRKERAARRARRSDGGDDGVPDDSADISLAESDFVVDLPQGHPRAPGDEEEYTTPERPERPAKRTRLDDDADEAEAEAKNERRVKWNRGLATTVFLDDALPQPKRAPNDAPVKKGCLAPSAKARQLDTMGNVLNAETPLPEVQPENVVVKKFVYEDDEVPAPEPAPTPAPAKSTRSKSKKSRT
ncbi:hypothetical protein PsYK624_113050 [Phanerochaete sordida]|uniref:Uncharacterized protein n=1 Tax=Phanerochaete sordida TaxID=48140 RepID=A0A9P3LHZ2_9APHY|nr:hypothetical protein PsYK624_113050 [Phanerochaete sordida]